MKERVIKGMGWLWRRLRLQPAHSRRGDKARARHDWQRAARHYRRHLALYDNDHAIWIQLAHARKEAGQLGDAEHAYRHAIELGAVDQDLLLHLGHLLARMDRPTEAIEILSQHIASHPDPETLGLIQHLSLTSRRDIHENERGNLERSITTFCDGLSAMASHQISLGKDREIILTGVDPWIEFALSPTFDHLPALKLSIDLTWQQDSFLVSGRLYFDYGEGYSERNAVGIRVDRQRTDLLIASPGSVRRIRWDPDEREGSFVLNCVSVHILDADNLEDEVRKVGLPSHAAQASALRALEELYGIGAISVEQTARLQKELQPGVDLGLLYDQWLRRYVTPDANDYLVMAGLIASMPIRPLFSFVVPVYNTPPVLLRACIESMLAQTYPEFQVCLCDDASTDPEIGEILRHYEALDDRIHVSYRTTNGHISAASNSALAMARGEFVVLVDHDDLIPDYALLVVADTINNHPTAAILFSDEDKVDLEGYRHSPYFKGDFDRFLMYGHNMVSHLGIYRRNLLAEIGGFREGLEGSQDYDLFLRAYELVGDEGVVHIPHVLYHWRTTPGSTSIAPSEKSYAFVAAQRAISDHFRRTDQPLLSSDGIVPGLSAVTAVDAKAIPATAISFVICTRDRYDLLYACVNSLPHTEAGQFEIIIVDNGSTDRKTLDYLSKLEKSNNVQVIRQPGAFNFSSLNNAGAAAARSDILCFLNNDTQASGLHWLDRARLWLSMPDIGVVGARLLYPAGTVQHFGIGLGMAEQRVAGVLHVKSPANDPGYFGKARLLQQFSSVTAACMFVRRLDFETLGGFDPSLAVAYNDVDLCLRYRQAGFRVLCDPEIELIHRESETRGADTDLERLTRLNQEADLMRKRWSEVLDNDPFLSPNQDLGRSHFALAYPPRVPVPWRRKPSLATSSLNS